MSDDYIKGLQTNREITEDYYRKSILKTEQQKFLEEILTQDQFTPSLIADIACGGGTLSYHLHKMYPRAEFYLADLNPQALELARQTCGPDNFHFYIDNIYNLETLPSDFFDAVFCWQTLSWIDQPELALRQMLRLLKTGGKLYLSSLFNLDHDVDIYARVKDHTREGDTFFSYNTYSKKSIDEWIGKQVQRIQFHPFHPN